MIGLSVYQCVIDIVLRKVDVRDVKKIISGRKTDDDHGWENLLVELTKQWENDDHLQYYQVDECQRVAQSLREMRKIVSSHSEGRKPLLDNGRPHWVADEEDIEWRPLQRVRNTPRKKKVR